MNRILFVQLPPPRFSFDEPPTNIPLAAGFLASTLDRYAQIPIDVLILESDVVDLLGDQGILLNIVERNPNIVAMTLYVWNAARSLFLAANVKRRLPHVKILIGGPEVTPDNSWVMRHPAVDVGVFGEGESRITQVVEILIKGGDLSKTPGIFFKENGASHINPVQIVPWNLAAVSYPYLTKRIAASRQGTLFLETVRGCPFRCRYCYYHKAFSGVRFHPDSAVQAVLDYAYDTDSHVREMYLMDPTFNARPGFRDLLRSMARRRESKNLKLHTELRADLLNHDDCALFQDAGQVSVEIGLQTINPNALQQAGRKGDPEKTAHGADLLKKAGIEVTTGIILGLPGDTPEGFGKTLNWLHQTQAYSVVHPFILSVLPGTDFRASADRLGLQYDPRPPYYVRSTPSFPEESFRTALLECESLFEMELDYIPPPALVDLDTMAMSEIADVPYISTWIVDPTKSASLREVPRIAARSTDPFVLWFRGNFTEKAVLSFLTQFTSANPYTCLHAVLEFPEIPRTRFFEKALAAAALPGHFLNKSLWPLYLEGEIVNVNFWIIYPDPRDSNIREQLSEEYLSVAGLIWDTTEIDPDRLMELETPILFSGGTKCTEQELTVLLKTLQKAHGGHPERVLFRKSELEHKWRQLNGLLSEPSTFSRITVWDK